MQGTLGISTEETTKGGILFNPTIHVCISIVQLVPYITLGNHKKYVII